MSVEGINNANLNNNALIATGIGAVAAGGIGLIASMLAGKEKKAVEDEKTV